MALTTLEADMLRGNAHTSLTQHPGAQRTLLAAATSAQSTYIALAILALTLIALGVTFCIVHGKCCQREEPDKVNNDINEDFALTTVRSAVSSRGSIATASMNSAATSVARMERAIAMQRSTSDENGSGFGSPQSPMHASWCGKLDGSAHHRAGLIGKRPASQMGTLQPFRMPARQGSGAARRPGALPTIPSVTSLGSAATRSSFSDAFSLNLGGGGGGGMERTTSTNLAQQLDVQTPGSDVLGASPPCTPANEDSGAMPGSIDASGPTMQSTPLQNPYTGARGRSMLPRSGGWGARRNTSLHSAGRSPSVGSSEGDFAAIREDDVLQVGQNMELSRLWASSRAPRPGWAGA